MAGQHGYPTKYLRLLALLVLVCLVAALTRWVAPLHRSPPPPSPRPNRPTRSHAPAQPNLNPDSEQPAPRLNRIHGRWETVRTSLGLPPPPHRVIFTPGSESLLPGRPDKRASRFDLVRKRREEEAARRLPPLYFAPDVRHALDPTDQEQASPPTPLHDTSERESSPSARQPQSVDAPGRSGGYLD